MCSMIVRTVIALMENMCAWKEYIRSKRGGGVNVGSWIRNVKVFREAFTELGLIKDDEFGRISSQAYKQSLV